MSDKIQKAMELIEQANKDFKRLSPAKQRVAIAEDIIKQIRVGQYHMKRGVWADVNLPGEFCEVGQLSLHAPAVACNCCGIGAVLLSTIRCANEVTRNVNDLDFDYTNRTFLEQFFEPEQLDMIETAFELGNGACTTEDDDDRARAVEFGQKYRDHNKRGLAIFQNIIKNGGTFKPGKA